MMKNLFIVLALLFSATFAHAQKENNSALLTGKDYSFTVSAPKDWVADSEAGKNQGLQVVFYPKGSSWKNASAVIYTTVNYKADNGGTLEKFIEVDVADFKSKSDKLQVTKGDVLTTAKGANGKERKAEVRCFTGDQFGNYEAIAYIEEGNAIVSFILTSQKKKDFEASLPAFKELVASYYFLTDKVKTGK